MMHLLGRHRHMFADRYAVSRCCNLLKWSACCLTWFEIPDIHRAWTSTHPQENRRLVLFFELLGISKQRIGK
jgi:hypothetical protein